MNSSLASIAYLIFPHGYGHAARACAVMSAICELSSSISLKYLQQPLSGFFSNKFQVFSRITVYLHGVKE
jgi:hypothetical protein